ncbi:hypothetical protein EJ08DRAFT_692775 [Tothia fuscella]|uniref:Uncharacterized protein n=1 Tax=Tothia fuscella TaxID=1048955 RepID=A0A9P4U419_9PEZI|nr:hypothetical protein EJ08DRAFT_692775 [Tothia fuscella]
MRVMDISSDRIRALAPELRNEIFTQLPEDTRREVDPTQGRRSQQVTPAPFDPYARALVPSTGKNSPLLKLPSEMRRQIYKYLLPEKGLSIEPLNFSRSRKDARKKHMETVMRLRAVRQRQQQQFQQQHVQYTNFMVNGGNAPVAHQPQLFLPFNTNPAPTIHHGHAPHAGAPVHPLSAWQQAQAAAPPAIPINPFHLNGTFPPMINPFAPQVIPLVAPPAASPRSHERDPAKDVELQRALRTAELDRSPENMVTALLLVNHEISSEVAEVMYDEYTFEVHIHANGVDFLHLNHIDTFETYGLSLAPDARKAFNETRMFCFQRMRHIEFVMWGGDPTKRTASAYMRQSVRKLVDMLLKEHRPVIEVKVRFELEETGFDIAPSAANNEDAKYHHDKFGTFWRNKVDKCARSSFAKNTTNVEMVCTPLESLRGVSKVSFCLPAQCHDDQPLKQYMQFFTRTIMSKFPKEGAELADYQDLLSRQRLQDDIVLDAAHDFDLKHGPAKDGYYPEHPLAAERRLNNLSVDDCIRELAEGTTQIRMREVTPTRDDVSTELFNQWPVKEGDEEKEYTSGPDGSFVPSCRVTRSSVTEPIYQAPASRYNLRPRQEEQRQQQDKFRALEEQSAREENVLMNQRPISNGSAFQGPGRTLSEISGAPARVGGTTHSATSTNYFEMEDEEMGLRDSS